MKNKLLILICLLLISIPCIVAPSVVERCNNITNYTSMNITENNISLWYNLTVNPSCWLGNVINITPTQSFYLNITLLYTVNCGSSYGLYFCNVINSTISIYNTTNSSQIYGAGNYTLELYNFTRPGTLVINDNCSWNNSDFTIRSSYNFSTAYDLYNTTCLGLVAYYVNNSSGIGEPGLLTISDSDLAGYNWTVNYNQLCQNCSNYTIDNMSSCRSTQTIIFSAFGLIIIAGLVAAAFVIIQIIGGNFDATLLSATVVGLIALSIVIMMGYIIIAQVGLTVCN